MFVIVVPPVLCVLTKTTGDGEHCARAFSLMLDKNLAENVGSTVIESASASSQSAAEPSHSAKRLERKIDSKIFGESFR